jgi:hypothetical protein
MLAYHQYGEPPEFEGISESLFQLYRMRTAQCLLSGDIAKCLPYTVETLRFNATAELNRKDDNHRGLWIMTGLIVRAAINMGYHREPSNSPGFSALQAEYRRRIWSSVFSMDNMTSFSGGFPRMTCAIYADTLEPRNLHDWELSENAAVLPPSRPLAEPTAVTYLIVKGRLCEVLGRVADFNSAAIQGSYETVLEIDQALRDVYEKCLLPLKTASVRTTRKMIQSTANFSKLSLLSMYHKGMCTLHRRFLAKERGGDRFKLSHERCVSSALAVLTFQGELDPSFYKISQTRQMLIHSALVLFLELELRRKFPAVEMSPDSSVLLQTLEQTCALCVEVTGVCEEAKRTSDFLAGMLSGIQTVNVTSATSSQQVPSETSFGLAGFGSQQNVLKEGFPGNDPSNVNFDWVSTCRYL